MHSASKNNQTAKDALRPQLIQTRSQIPPGHRQSAANIVARKILSHSYLTQAAAVSVFISVGDEINTRKLLTQLIHQQKTVYCPAITGGTMELRLFNSFSSCITGPKNIPEPPASAPTIEPQKIDVFIVPGLGFDTRRHRIGYGKGYYDKLLAGTRGYKIGICFTDQLCYQLPHNPHDIPMNQVISEAITI